MRILLYLFSVSFVVFACSQPVQRNVTPTETVPGPVLTEKTPVNMPDLKKKIWIMNFSDYENTPEPLKTVSVAEIIRQPLITAFGDSKGPFLSQTPDDEQALVGFRLDTKKDPVEISRFLRGSDVSGFLMGQVSKLDVLHEGGNKEGLVKSHTVTFVLELSYELYDTSSGKRIVRGKDSQSYSETRSEFLGIGAEIPELPTKVQGMAGDLAQKIVKKLAPFAEKLAWSGRVLRIDGGRVYINAGRKTGLIVGDVLKVLEPLKEIQDPQSGAFVGTAPGRTKGTVKLIQYFGVDGAIGVLQSGGGVQPDDRVELY